MRFALLLGRRHRGPLRRLSLRPALSCAGAASLALATGCGGAPTARPLVRRVPAAAPPHQSAAPVGKPSALAQPYFDTLSGRLAASVAGDPERVYVPAALAGEVDVIDPASFRVVAQLRVGSAPEQVTPDWDMRRLWVDNEASNTLSEIDPRTTRVVRTIALADPYDLYFTPDGREAIVVGPRAHELDVRDRRTWRLIAHIAIPGRGFGGLDFTASGRSLVIATDDGRLMRVALGSLRVTGSARLGGDPDDVRLSPDGRYFFVSNEDLGGVSLVAASSMRVLGFIHTGAGARGMTFDRSTRSMFVANPVSGTISVIDVATRRLVRTWQVGGSPDALQLSPDGRQLWASGLSSGNVYVIDSSSGRLVHTIGVAAGAHGLSFFPNAGSHSLGGGGVYR